MYHFLLRKWYPALWPRGQPQEDGGPLPACSREVYHPPPITIGETELKSVQQFSYLGCTISSDARIDKEIDNRLAKASSAFGRLYKRVWNNKNLKIQTKVSVYRAVALTTLLYGSEAGFTYRSHVRLLERFHQRCLPTILKVHWSEFITNVEVLEQAKVPSINNNNNNNNNNNYNNLPIYIARIYMC